MRAVVAVAVFALAAAASGQDRPRARGATTQNPPVSEVQGKSKPVPGEAGSNPALGNPPSPSTYDKNGAKIVAQLLHAEQETKAGAADVKVTVSKIQLVDPDNTGGKAKNGQGHLVYRVDDGPSIVTTATKLGFRDLPHGKHRIVVELVANDGTPIGPHQVLQVAIP